jgi:hypothetical protein
MIARKTFKFYNFLKVVLSLLRLAILGGFLYFNIAYFETEYGILSDPTLLLNDTFSEDMFATPRSTIIFSLYFGAAIVYNFRMILLPFILIFLLSFSCCICCVCNCIDLTDSIYLFLSG